MLYVGRGRGAVRPDVSARRLRIGPDHRDGHTVTPDPRCHRPAPRRHRDAAWAGGAARRRGRRIAHRWWPRRSRSRQRGGADPFRRGSVGVDRQASEPSASRHQRVVLLDSVTPRWAPAVRAREPDHRRAGQRGPWTTACDSPRRAPRWRQRRCSTPMQSRARCRARGAARTGDAPIVRGASAFRECARGSEGRCAA
jgi:hypothetical protein